VLVEALNPKTAAFFLPFVPQFVDPSAGRVATQFAALGVVSVPLNTWADVMMAMPRAGYAPGSLVGLVWSDGCARRPQGLRRPLATLPCPEGRTSGPEPGRERTSDQKSLTTFG